VNLQWKLIADEDQLWKGLCIRNFGQHQKENGYDKSWRLLYASLETLRWDCSKTSPLVLISNNKRTAQDVCKGNEKFRWVTTLGAPGYSKGKHYVEILIDKCCPMNQNTIKIAFGCAEEVKKLTNNCPFGFNSGDYSHEEVSSWAYLADGRFMAKSKFSGKGGDKWGEGDRIGIFLDIDSRIITFYKNGTLQGEQTLALPDRPIKLFPAISLISGNQVTLQAHSSKPPTSF